MNDEMKNTDPEVYGKLDPEQAEELRAAVNTFVSAVLKDKLTDDTWPEITQSAARFMFPLYLQTYGKIIDVSDITERALELDPAAGNLKVALIREQNSRQNKEQNETARAEAFSILDQLNTAAFMEIFRHHVKAEEQGSQSDQGPTYEQFQKTEIAERFSFPIDKVNRNFVRIWELITTAPKNQIMFDVTPQRQTNKDAAAKSLILLSLEKRGSKAKPIEAYDMRVMIAANALHEKNTGRPFTLQALYEQMGDDGKLGGKNRTRILESMESMNSYWLHIDNETEAENQRGRKKYQYHGSLLPFEYVDELENGQITKTHIRMLRSAPLMEFAEERKQFTTISRQLLQTPISHTEANIQIEDYLIAEISGIKKGRRNNKMLFGTIFEETGQTSRKQQERAKEKIIKVLEHYKNTRFISGYKILTDGVEVFYNKPEPEEKPKRSRRKTVRAEKR